MLFALRHPAILLGLLVGFAVGLVVRATVQDLVAAGPRRGRLRSVRRMPGMGRRGSGLPLAGYLDPYGAVAAVVSGVGWGARPPVPARRGARALTPLAVALGAHAVLAAAGFAAYVALDGPAVLGRGVTLTDILHGTYPLGGTGAQVAVGFGAVSLGCALLELVPVPPLLLGILLWSRLPKTAGARRFAYHLLEEAWGVVVILVGLLLPLAGQRPLFLALLDIAADPLLRLVQH